VRKLRLRVLGEAREEEQELPLDHPGASGVLKMQCLAGASGIHLEVLGPEGTEQRLECPADEGDSVAFRLTRRRDGSLGIESPGRQVYVLPVADRYAPPAPILPTTEPEQLDLVVLVDGTTRRFTPRKGGSEGEKAGWEAGLRLKDRASWSDTIEPILATLKEVAEGYRECRAAVLAFGDHPSPHVAARDLRPSYVVLPATPRLRPLEWDRLHKELISLKASAGGDYVDALAEGLEAARKRVKWGPDARKLLVVVGDSPGHSIMNPSPQGADLHARDLDVEVEALRLHRSGVVIATIHLRPPESQGWKELEFGRELVAHTVEQYLELASHEGLAVSVEEPNRESLAGIVRGLSVGPIGRGICVGRFLGADFSKANAGSEEGEDPLAGR
jgi:hypothetical protein